jgi:hypothetical protein
MSSDMCWEHLSSENEECWPKDLEMHRMAMWDSSRLLLIGQGKPALPAPSHFIYDTLSRHWKIASASGDLPRDLCQGFQLLTEVAGQSLLCVGSALFADKSAPASVRLGIWRLQLAATGNVHWSLLTTWHYPDFQLGFFGVAYLPMVEIVCVTHGYISGSGTSQTLLCCHLPTGHWIKPDLGMMTVPKAAESVSLCCWRSQLWLVGGWDGIKRGNTLYQAPIAKIIALFPPQLFEEPRQVENGGSRDKKGRMQSPQGTPLQISGRERLESDTTGYDCGDEDTSAAEMNNSLVELKATRRRMRETERKFRHFQTETQLKVETATKVLHVLDSQKKESEKLQETSKQLGTQLENEQKLRVAINKQVALEKELRSQVEESLSNSELRVKSVQEEKSRAWENANEHLARSMEEIERAATAEQEKEKAERAAQLARVEKGALEGTLKLESSLRNKAEEQSYEAQRKALEAVEKAHSYQHLHEDLKQAHTTLQKELRQEATAKIEAEAQAKGARTLWRAEAEARQDVELSRSRATREADSEREARASLEALVERLQLQLRTESIRRREVEVDAEESRRLAMLETGARCRAEQAAERSKAEAAALRQSLAEVEGTSRGAIRRAEQAEGRLTDRDQLVEEMSGQLEAALVRARSAESQLADLSSQVGSTAGLLAAAEVRVSGEQERSQALIAAAKKREEVAEQSAKVHADEASSWRAEAQKYRAESGRYRQQARSLADQLAQLESSLRGDIQRLRLALESSEERTTKAERELRRVERDMAREMREASEQQGALQRRLVELQELLDASVQASKEEAEVRGVLAGNTPTTLYSPKATPGPVSAEESHRTATPPHSRAQGSVQVEKASPVAMFHRKGLLMDSMMTSPSTLKEVFNSSSKKSASSTTAGRHSPSRHSVRSSPSGRPLTPSSATRKLKKNRGRKSPNFGNLLNETFMV